MDDDIPDSPKRKRGRPPGSRSKPILQRGDIGAPPPADKSKSNYGSDPGKIISRQLELLDWGQQVLHADMLRCYQRPGPGLTLDHQDVLKLEKMSNAIVRAVDALKKSTELADELSSRMSPEQLLEAALAKLETQDAATIRYYIRRLRAKLDSVAPEKVDTTPTTAADAIASLE